MASHEYVRFILKTPTGFLTRTGTTEDICDKNIIILNILDTGGFTARKDRQVEEFFERSTASKVNPEECEVWYHCCNDSIAMYDCENCVAYDSCDLLHNRKRCKFQKVEE